jgi:hypothetical protein
VLSYATRPFVVLSLDIDTLKILSRSLLEAKLIYMILITLSPLGSVLIILVITFIGNKFNPFVGHVCA